MNQQEFNDYLEALLGGNLVDVELQPEDFMVAFKRAKDTFIQKGNNNLDKRFVPLNVSREETEYDIDPNVDTIVRIIKPAGAFHTQDPLSIAVFNDIFHQFSMDSGSLLNYELSRQLIERIQKYTSYYNDFIWNRRTHKLTLLKKPEASNQVWFLESYANLSDEEYRDMLWIQSWALAELKIILGRAYSKFSGGMPSPVGGTVSLPGQDLVQEGNQDKERLLEEIKNFVDGDETGLFIHMG